MRRQNTYNSVTSEQQEHMKELGKTMTAKEISKELKMPYSTVHYYMSKKSIKRKLGKKLYEYERPLHKEKNRPGYFNVHAVENWLA